MIIAAIDFFRCLRIAGLKYSCSIAESIPVLKFFKPSFNNMPLIPSLAFRLPPPPVSSPEVRGHRPGGGGGRRVT